MKNYFIILGFLLVYSCHKTEKISIPQEGLVVNIPLDGDAVEIVNNLTGSIHAVHPYPDHHGIANQAMYFNRDDSAYLDFGDASSFSFPQNIFTLCCWVFVSDTSQPITILSKRNATGPFEYSLDNHMAYAVFNFDNWIASGSTTVYGTDPLNASLTVETNEWIHIAISADGFMLRAYRNGYLLPGIDSIKSGNSFSDTDAPLQIGVGGGYGKYYFFDGAIDDILIYNRALSSLEIMTIAEL
ncbi:MAG: LamG domain-containing protein [Chitinophagales bacterium]